MASDSSNNTQRPRVRVFVALLTILQRLGSACLPNGKSQSTPISFDEPDSFQLTHAVEAVETVQFPDYDQIHFDTSHYGRWVRHSQHIQHHHGDAGHYAKHASVLAWLDAQPALGSERFGAVPVAQLCRQYEAPAARH